MRGLPFKWSVGVSRQDGRKCVVSMYPGNIVCRNRYDIRWCTLIIMLCFRWMVPVVGMQLLDNLSKSVRGYQNGIARTTTL